MNEMQTKRKRGCPFVSRLALYVAPILLALMWGQTGLSAVETPSLPLLKTGCALPGFALPDTWGKLHRLTERRGRSVLLFFFCGCAPCHDCARAWADVQGSGELELLTPKARPPRAGETPLTWIVYTGDAASSERFLAETGLDRKQTLLLLDTNAQTADRYRAEPCPRVFVADFSASANATLTYTNPTPQADAPASAATSLVARTLTELRRCAQPDRERAPRSAGLRAAKTKATKDKSHAH